MRNDSQSANVDTSRKEISDGNAPPTRVPIETSIKEKENGKKTIGTGNEDRDAFPEQDATLQEHDNTDGFSDDGHLSPTIYKYPAPEFHSFEEDRSPEKFKPGQVWAMYGGSCDAFPRQYGWINKVEPEPFMVHLMWLEAYPRQFQEKCWPEQQEQDIPISCGTFRVLNEGAKFDTTEVFSHPVDAGETGVPRQLEILPRVGEVRAVYTRWIPASSIVYASEFALVEVIGRTEAGTRLSVLAKVDGYVAVFKPDEGNGVLEIPAGESSRSFSHCIPCFRLTGEEGGDELRGFYELDTPSVPYSAVLSVLCGQDKP